ncbi:dual specificity protein phosphatase 3, partial [Trichonephila clavipes]
EAHDIYIQWVPSHVGSYGNGQAHLSRISRSEHRTSDTHRRRTPLPRFSTLRKERTSRPLSTSYLYTPIERDIVPPSYISTHLSRREVPLCTPDDLLDIIREPTGYYALPTDPWNEVYSGIYLSDA